MSIVALVLALIPQLSIGGPARADAEDVAIPTQSGSDENDSENPLPPDLRNETAQDTWDDLAERERSNIVQQPFRERGATWLQRAAESDAANKDLRDEEMRAQQHREMLESAVAPSALDVETRPVVAAGADDGVPQSVAITGIVIAMGVLASVALFRRWRPERREKRRRRGAGHTGTEARSHRRRRRQSAQTGDAESTSPSAGSHRRGQRKSRRQPSSTTGS